MFGRNKKEKEKVEPVKRLKSVKFDLYPGSYFDDCYIFGGFESENKIRLNDINNYGSPILVVIEVGKKIKVFNNTCCGEEHVTEAYIVSFSYQDNKLIIQKEIEEDE